MKKNDVFTFTAPNGVEVTAVVIDYIRTDFEEITQSKHWESIYLCYAQNRLFYYIEWTQIDKEIDDDFHPSSEYEDDYYYAIEHHSHDVKTTGASQKILVDYCILPDYDSQLEAYYHELDMADDYASKEC